MKKELFAALLLALILALSLFNTRELSALCGEVTALAEEACLGAKTGDWDGAVSSAGAAVRLWLGSGGYTHIVLHHGEIDAMTADLYGLLEAAYAEDDAGVRASSGLVAAHLESVSSMDRIRLGSIF